MAEHAEVVGLVPAAGRGKRIAPLPCSKEIFPIGFRRDDRTGELRPRVACHDLFAKFHRAGVRTAYVILREGKWDIPAYLGEGAVVGMSIAYIVVNDSIGPPDTLDRAYPFIRTNIIAFGFPDILLSSDDVFDRLLRYLQRMSADVVLALYPARDVQQSDMIELDGESRVRSVILKPRATQLTYTWACAVWRPAFTEFMHMFVARERAKVTPGQQAYSGIDAQGDLPVGAVIQAAIQSGVVIHGLTLPNDTFLDIGTASNLVEALKQSALRP